MWAEDGEVKASFVQPIDLRGFLPLGWFISTFGTLFFRLWLFVTANSAFSSSSV